MVSKQVIRVIIEAEETISKAAKQAEKAINDLGKNGKRGIEGINEASENAHRTMSKMENFVNSVRTKFDTLKQSGSNAFDSIKEKVGSAVNSMGKITNVSTIAAQSMEKIKGVSDSIGSKFESLRNKISSLGSSSEKTFTEISNNEQKSSSSLHQLGSVIDNVKLKVRSLGETAKTSITSGFSSAVTGAKEKLTSLGGNISQARSRLTQFGNSARSTGASLGFLSNAASMTVGMIGYDLVSSVIECTRASLNARSSIQAFGSRLSMSSSEVDNYQASLDKLQTTYKKVDMDVVGQQAMDMAYRLGIGKESLEKLTETTVIFSDAMKRNGRSAEDSMLAMSDAMDGEFRRLKEIGISQQDLINNGWNEDLNDKTSLLNAMNKALKEQHYDVLAQSVDNLDDAWQVLTITLSNLLESILVPLTPTIIGVISSFSDGVTEIMGFVGALQSVWSNMPDWQKAALLIAGVALAVGALALAIKLNLIPGLLGTVAHFLLVEAESFIMVATNLGLSAAFGLLAGSIWATVSALLAFVAPILAVVAVIGLIVVAIYEVGKAFGWWSDVGSMLAAIKDGISKLWEAFINHPDVQAAISSINWALNELGKWIGYAWNEILKFFGVSTSSNWDVTRSIIEAIGLAWDFLSFRIRAAIFILQGAWGVLSWLVGIAVGVGQAIYDALKPIVCILLGCSPGIVPALQTVMDVFSTVWESIVSLLGGIIPNVIAAIQPVLDILTLIGEFLLTTFQFAWQTMIVVFMTVWTHLQMIILIFSQFLSGQITLSAMLSQIWTVIQSLFTTVLTLIINRVRIFATQIVANAIAAATGFVNAIISRITSLPGRVFSILLDIVGRIASAGASWISTASSKASSMVSAMMNYISQLPGKVYNEFMNIGSRMLSAGSDLVNKARQIGEDIVNGLLDAMGIHSPGIIQEKVVNEFKSMVGRIRDWIKPAGETAKEMGETIVDEFGDPSLSTNADSLVQELDTPKMGMDVGVDTSQITTANQDVITQYDDLANLTGLSLDTMVAKDQVAYTTIKNNDALTLSAMSTNLQQKMSMMSNNVSTNLNNIVSKNRISMNTVTNTTKSQLNTIVSKTKSANSEMISSWEYMKNGIISAADKIRSDSTNHFNKLSNTIGDFYGKLKNPSRWGAGSPITTSRTSRSSKGLGKITQAIKNANLPQYLGLGEIKANPLIQAGNFGDYVIRDNKKRQFDVAQLLKHGAIKIGLGAGSYNDIPEPHVKLIKDTSKEWDMSGPLIGPYSTSKGFKVKEFLEGVPRIAYDTFRQIAEEVYSQTDYEFYYDDDHHGNWINAFNAGSMNCKHGAESIIAMANAMGLSGYMQHGHWDEYGHYFAVIEGHKMDVTGWQQRRTWTPSASAGPAPRRYGLKEFIEELKESFKENGPNDKGTNPHEDKLTGEFTFIHDFKNLPEGVSAEDVAKMVEDSATNEGFLKKIAQHPAFQRYDLREKVKIERQNNRARGV